MYTNILLQVHNVLAITSEYAQHVQSLLTVLGDIVVPHHTEEMGSQNTKVVKLHQGCGLIETRE